jgi:hypothetical protein
MYGDPGDEPDQPIAHLQAGLLDDGTAARLRHRTRTDPAATAPDVPADVTARIGAALGDAALGHAGVRRAAHAVGRPRLRGLQVLGPAVGLGATLVAIVVGAVMLVRDPAPTRSATPTAESITVSRPPPNIPLSDPQILGLLSHDPDYGPLADPQRRSSCLSGLGYPGATTVLGARPVDMDGRPGVLLLMPGNTAKAVAALIVDPNCNSAHTGLLADTVITRP